MLKVVANYQECLLKFLPNVTFLTISEGKWTPIEVINSPLERSFQGLENGHLKCLIKKKIWRIYKSSNFPIDQTTKLTTQLLLNCLSNCLLNYTKLTIKLHIFYDLRCQIYFDWDKHYDIVKLFWRGTKEILKIMNLDFV